MTGKIYFLSLFLLLGILRISAQSGLSITSEKEITVLNEQIVGLMLEIENKSTQPAELNLRVKADEGIRLVSQENNINLGAPDKMFLPFKIYIEKKQPSGKSIIEFSLIDKNGAVVAKSKTTLVIETKRSLRIMSTNPQQLIYQVGDSLNITAKILNQGNQREEVKVIASFPSISGTQQNIEQKISVAPFSSTDIQFSRIVDRNILRMELFTVNIAGVDSKGDYFGNAIVTVQNAQGNRRYMDPNSLNPYISQYRQNHITYIARNPFDKTNGSHNAEVHLEGALSDLTLSMNLNGTIYDRPDIDPVFQNTYLRAEKNRFSLQAGNLFTSNLEISLMGRGIEAAINENNSHKSNFKIGAVEKSYNLFDPLSLRNSPRGYSMFGIAEIPVSDNAMMQSQIVYDEDPFQKGTIIKQQYTYNDYEKNKYFSTSLAYGELRSLGTTPNKEPSFAASLQYRNKLGKYQISSNNYYSSGYYPGNRKGSLQFDERVSRQFGRVQTWAGFNFNEYDPKHIDPMYPFSNASKRNTISAGAAFALSKKIRMSASPIYSSETSQVYMSTFESAQSIEFKLYQLYTTFETSTRNNRHVFTLLVAPGVSAYPGFSGYKSSIKAQLTYNFENLTFSAQYQKGNYLLYEGVRYGGDIIPDVEKLTLMASYRRSFFQNKLSFAISGILSKESALGDSFSLSSNIDYQLFRKTKVFTYIGLNKFKNDFFQNDNIYYQIGITQTLPNIGEAATNYKNGQINLFVFYDNNNDGVFTAEVDTPAQNARISINKMIFIADKNGQIKYRALPYGDYQVVNLDNAWYAEDQNVQLNSKEVNLTMSLEKTGVVQGAIQYQKSGNLQYDVYEVYAGIPILLTNERGKVFKTFVGENGRFTAYVPLGSYSVSVDENGLQRNVYLEENLHKINVTDETATQLKTFILKVKEKKLDIKRFGE